MPTPGVRRLMARHPSVRIHKGRKGVKAEKVSGTISKVGKQNGS
jgi:hypothetical protein